MHRNPARAAMKFALAVAVAVALAGFARQRRRPIPLPPWLSFLLENPITEHFVGGGTLVRRLDLSPGMRVLDAGCGPGRLSIPLAKAVGPEGEVAALDNQGAMLERLRGRVEEESLSNVRAVLGDLGEAALEKDHFDRALLAMVLGEVRDRAGGLRAVHAALKPGGLLSITETLGDPDYHRPATVRREAEAAGFRLVAEHGGFPAYTLNFEKPSA